MRFLFFSTETRPIIGGIARALDGWLTGLTIAGHEVCMVSMLSERWRSQTYRLVERPYREEWLWLPGRTQNAWDRFIITRKFRSAMYLIQQDRLIKRRAEQVLAKFQPDVVVFAVLNPVACLPLNQVSARGLRSAAIAYGSEIHPKRVPNSRWLRKTLARMDQLIAISEYTRQRLIEWTGESSQIAVIHPALSPDMEANWDQETGTDKSADQPRSREVRLLTVCRLVERKGVQTVLSSVRQLRDRGIPVEYDIVGEGPYRPTLENMVDELDLRGTVKFWGNVEDSRCEQLLTDCDIFVMVPFEDSRGDVEGFGIVFLEAGLFSKPVIGSYSGGVPDAIKEAETGLLVASEDPTRLARVIQALINDPHEKERLRKNGHAWARLHSPSEIGKNLVNLLSPRTD